MGFDEEKSILLSWHVEINTFPKILQHIGEWLPSFHFGSGAWNIIQGNSPDLKNYLILLGYLVVFILVATYIRGKQEN
ncbi:hypothetical protein [Oceanobacillus limi]|uniref:hypothetical protein n=1 Tax=Oceanobacillus limi TaxID=930131 RepID=UPI000B872B52|nr:hypothetical protein [Oceanobacillus limi]